uniref:Uncharacterized protein n=1 Tax=Rhizophora mucronata TaxID=61149 RepID=A0A2P2P4S9_RHIMU
MQWRQNSMVYLKGVLVCPYYWGEKEELLWILMCFDGDGGADECACHGTTSIF